MDRLAAIILGFFLLLAAIVFGLFHFASRSDSSHEIAVTGAATEPFESDVVKWSIMLSRQVGNDMLADGYTQIRADLATVRQTLRAAGVPDSAIGTQPVNANPTWDQFGTRTGYSLDQSVYVIAEGGGEGLERLALDPGPLVEAGVVLNSSRLEYFYSGIDELKHQLLARATQDARQRAEEIAGGSEMTVKGIASARSGVFQITEPFSTEMADYGVHNTSTRSKEITVTVHATFEVD